MARRMGKGLVAVSSAAIMAVYAAGYVHTEPAAAQIAAAQDAATPTAARQADGQGGRADAPAYVAPTPTAVAQDGGFAAPPALAPALPAPTATVAPAAPAAAQGQYRDGTYTGSGENRHGYLEVTVVVKGGRIASAAISDCEMQYPCSRIATLPGEAVARQSADVDLISRATMSSEAYQEAVQQALAKAAA